tara:strand:+ start:1049 stop:1279 length:231 start_codon:yes stop_codon:yes gene_type:complete
MDYREHYRKVQTLQARIEEMHDENSRVYEKLNEARERLLDDAITKNDEYALHLISQAMGILHGYTNPNLTPPKEGN